MGIENPKSKWEDESSPKYELENQMKEMLDKIKERISSTEFTQKKLEKVKSKLQDILEQDLSIYG